MNPFRTRKFESGEMDVDEDASFADLSAMFATRVPEGDLGAVYAAAGRVATPRINPGRRLWRPAAAIAIVGVVAAALLVGPGLHGDGPPTVSAQELIQRAQLSAESLAPAVGSTPYHMVAATWVAGAEVPESRTETWYGGPGRVRNEHSFGPKTKFTVIANGEEAWIAQTLNENARAAHGPTAELRVAASAGVPRGGLSELVSQYLVDGCTDGGVVHDAEVLGRAVYRVVVTPTPASCATRATNNPDSAKLAAVAEKQGVVTVWIDKETMLTLKSEQLSLKGASVYRYEVTTLEVGTVIADSVFRYDDPSAIVTEVTNNTDAKAALGAAVGVVIPKP